MLYMFNDKKIEVISERFSEQEKRFSEQEKRIKEIEEQLKPKPAFEKGDIVNFFLINNEFVGEIVEQERESSYRSFFDYPSERETTGRWIIRYLDANNIPQEVAIKEEDIWVDEEDKDEYIHDRINRVIERVAKLEGRGNKNK